jgi:hypothetical protein
MAGRLGFSSENGEASLRRHFARVERRDVEGWVVFPDAAAIRAYLRSLILATDAAETVPELAEPLRATTRNTAFVAEKAA